MKLYPKTKNKLKYLNALLALIFVVQGVTNLTTKDSLGYLVFGCFQVLIGIFYGYMGYINFFSKSKFGPHLDLEDDHISLKEDMFSSHKKIGIGNILVLQIKPEQLGIKLSTGDQLNFPYNAPNKEEIINAVTRYAKEKGLKVEEVGYN